MPKNKNNGFILLEVVVSMAIIAIILIPFIHYFTNSIYILHRTEKESQAHKLAADTIEIFRMKATNDWSNIETEADNFSINDLSTNNDLFAADYELKVTISDFDFNDDGIIDSNDSILGRKISVSITYENGSREVQLDTLLRKR